MNKFEITTGTIDITVAAKIIYARGKHHLIPDGGEWYRRFFSELNEDQDSSNIVICVTTLKELHIMNGLSFNEEPEVWHNLAVPNYLAARIGLEPLGQEISLEVFGQDFHNKQPLYGSGLFAIGTIPCNRESSYWNKEKGLLLADAYTRNALRVSIDGRGICQFYPTSHIVRSSGQFVLLYKKAP